METPMTRNTTSYSRRRKQIYDLLTHQILPHIILLPAAAIFLIPFLWMVSTSLKPNEQLFAYPPVWIPNPIMWENYPRSVTYVPFFTYFGNTLFISKGGIERLVGDA